MKIYNKDKNAIIENPDLEKGYLLFDQIVSKTIPAVEAVEEQFHYVYKEYPNGGKDRIKVVDIPAVEAKPETYEYDDIQVYIPYTEKEYAEVTISKLIEKLGNTDYIANKLAEAVSKYITTGDNTEVVGLRTKYAKELADRESWRKYIDELQKQL